MRVGARERPLLIERERREQLEDEVDLLLLSRDVLERLGGGTREARERPGGLLEHVRHRLGGTRDRAGADRVEAIELDDRRLEMHLEEIDERVPLAGALEVLALVEADELAEALARSGS